MSIKQAFTYTLEPFEMKFKACTREPLGWKEEIRRIARELANESGNRPIIVSSSGGIDSELACRALFEEGVHFSVLTIEHAAGTNAADIGFAKRWCYERGIEQKIVKLDMPDFFRHTIERFIKDGYIAGNVFRYFQLFVLERIEEFGGFGVLGGGEQLYEIGEKKEPKEEDAYIEIESGFVAVMEWMRRENTEHRPYFYYSTPEAALAYLRIPIVDFAVRNPSVFRHPTNKYLFKRFVCQALWPDLGARMKMSGYEEILELRKSTQAKLRSRFGDLLQTYRLPVIEFRRELEGA